jgi:hypothetical protein
MAGAVTVASTTGSRVAVGGASVAVGPGAADAGVAVAIGGGVASIWVMLSDDGRLQPVIARPQASIIPQVISLLSIG